MDRIKTLPTTMVFSVLMLSCASPETAESQNRDRPTAARPLCLSQFALASHACSLLSPSPYEPPPPSDGDPDDSGELAHVNSDHRGGDRDGNGRGGRRRHRRQRRRHRRRETAVEEDCCRWVKAVDDECVCEVLVRLPVFLARPWHRLEVVVDASCNVTYDCAGRVLSV